MKWVSPTSPTHPPECGIYFWPNIPPDAGVSYTCFAKVWQLAYFVRRLLERSELIGVEETTDPDDEIVSYSVATDLDARGFPLSRRVMKMRFSGVDWETLQNTKVPDGVELPYSERRWLQAALGMIPVASEEKPKEVVSRDEPKSAKEPKPAKEARAPRASRDGLITLASMCEEAKVEPSDVRGLLRKRGIEKPESGWAVPAGHKLLGTFADIIAAVKRGEKK